MKTAQTGDHPQTANRQIVQRKAVVKIAQLTVSAGRPGTPSSRQTQTVSPQDALFNRPERVNPARRKREGP